MTLRANETTQTVLRKHEELQSFIKTHCQLRTYSFQVCIILYLIFDIDLQKVNQL